MSSGQPDPTFLIDRSLGSHELADALLALGYDVHTLASLFQEERAAAMEDKEWLQYAGERGWVCLMKDRVQEHHANRSKIIEYKVKCFCLTKRSLSGLTQVDRFVGNIHRIVQRSRKPGPYIYGVYAQTVLKLWPEQQAPSKRQARLLGRGDAAG